MRTLAFAIVIALAACDDDYPPCSEDTGIPQGPGGPIHGPTDPGPLPLPGPAPGPDQAQDDYRPRYSTNAAGEVCECGPYEHGCTDSPTDAARGACDYSPDGVYMPGDSSYPTAPPRVSGTTCASPDSNAGELFECHYARSTSLHSEETKSARVAHTNARAALEKLYRKLVSRGVNPLRIRCVGKSGHASWDYATDGPM
jgi:hypothetical protein